ncbi:MAG: hypothetical protein K0Q87_79 [Neobacillus sp.]|jgi:hypothetical protein|nr:hypothetical protein [Neobacillus sp.]
MDVKSYGLSKKYTDKEVTKIINESTPLDAMARQAATDSKGVDKVNLKQRLDDDYNEVSSALAQRVNHPFNYGYTIDVSKLDTIEKVNANWVKLKQFITDTKYNEKNTVKFNTLRTLHSVFAEWISGRNCPVGFYSDSTTDGATTTGHQSNTFDNTAFKVTINDSPNAYPTKFSSYVKLIHPNANVKAYNGGFDSQSYANGFGLRHWYNTWFRGLSGSNVDYSDVKMIVLGFGTSDSINLNDTASVIDAFSIDLECTIIDCFLRGVQPVIQAPILTTQRTGTTVSYRESDESVTIIETVQKRLCRKYNLEYLSLAEPINKALDGYAGLKYSYFVSADMVHPNDMGHRLIAGSLYEKFNPNIAKLGKEQSVKNLFAGHPAILTTDSENIAPDSKGGLILKTIPTGYISNDTYYYNWVSSEGNTKSYGDFLVRIPVFVEKPTALFYNNLENRRSLNGEKKFTIYSTMLNDGKALKISRETYHQPEEYYFSHKTFVCMLPYGLSYIDVTANNNPTEQRLGAVFLADAEKHLANVTFGRGSTNTHYGTKRISFNEINVGYTRKPVLTKERLDKYYNSTDAVPIYVGLTLEKALNAGITYTIYSHYNDVKGYQDCYNLVEILGDTITFKVAKTTGINTIFTQTITGLNALLVTGAKIVISYQSNDYNSTGVLFKFSVNGVLKHTYQANVDDVWSDGYGFDSPNIECSNIFITSWIPLTGFDLQFLV